MTIEIVWRWGDKIRIEFGGYVSLVIRGDSRYVFEDLVEEGLDPGPWLVREFGLFEVFPVPTDWSGRNRYIGGVDHYRWIDFGDPI